MTSLVGSNGAGKSSIFEALGFVLATRHRKYHDKEIHKLRSFGVDSESEWFVELRLLGSDSGIITLKRGFKAEVEEFMIDSD